MKLVSVIMPCYNDGEYIRESIETVRKQTYPSIELIIIDDGSDDIQTRQIIEEIEMEGFATVLHIEHKGLSVARNTGIQAANGEYLYNLDSDDLIEPQLIEEAVKIMDESDRIGIVYSRGDCFGAYNGSWDLPEYSEEAILVDNMIPATALYRKADWKQAGGYKTSMKYGLEDYDFWLSIIELGREVVRIPNVYLHYRIKSNSVTSRLLANLDWLKESFHQIYNQHPALYEKHRDAFIYGLRESQRNMEWECRRLTKSLTQIQAQLAKTQNQLSQVQHAYAEISNSTFWKITKPFRILTTAIKRTKLGGLLFKTVCQKQKA